MTGPVYFAGRRRPNAAVVAYRWRYEMGTITAAATGWAELGGPVALTVAGVLSAGVLGATACAASRARLIHAVQHVVVQHRVRTGCLHSGLTNRDGRLPRIVRTRTRGEVVTVSLWLPAGVSPEDVVAVRHRLASACGAAEVYVTAASPSRDRLRLLVVRPRWGMPGR